VPVPSDRTAFPEVLTTPVTGALASALSWLGAALMVVSGLVHLHLWDIAYRHVATLGPLFLLQAALALVMAVALAATRRWVVVLACISLMAGTIVGFVLVLTVGLFGFTLHVVTGWAVLAVVSEGGAIVALAIALWCSHSLRAAAPAPA
jgi:hypothetical protein